MSLQEVLRSESFSPGTGEAVYHVDFLSVTSLGLLAGLLLPYTAPDLDVEDERRGAGELESVPIVALDIFIADVVVRVVEHTVGSLALGVSVRGRFLDIHSLSTVHVVREDTLLVVGNLVVKQETLGTEFNRGLALATDVEKIALLVISELSVWFGTVKLRTELSVLLGPGELGQNERNKGEVCSQQHPSLE